MIKELIFEQKKYYEGSQPNLIEKKLKAVNGKIREYEYGYFNIWSSDYSSSKNISAFKKRTTTSIPSDVVTAVLNSSEGLLFSFDSTFILNGDTVNSIDTIPSSGITFYSWSDYVLNGGALTNNIFFIGRAVSKIRKEISMAIEEIIVEQKKYFKGKTQSYINRRVTKSAKVNVYNANANGLASVGNTTIDAGSTVRAQTVSKEQTYLNASYSGNLVNGWFSLTEFLQNGGVSHSPLTRLRQAFKSLSRLEVA